MLRLLAGREHQFPFAYNRQGFRDQNKSPPISPIRAEKKENVTAQVWGSEGGGVGRTNVTTLK